jgi:exopolysaccharide/PEP-CTERM locus tyrosine autokinase
MSRIEEALAKIQAQRGAGVPPPEPRKPIGRVREAEPGAPQSHHYGGKRIEVSFDELRARGLLAAGEQERKLADEYRAVKRPLLRNADMSRDPVLPRGNLLMIASALAGEGKTFTSLNLCLSIAREPDWNIVLVDGDCNKPHLTTLFGAEEEPGLMDLLHDSARQFDSVVMPTNLPGLSVLPAGKHDAHAAELLATARMSALCAEVAAADAQRIVIFDSPPLLLTAEAQALATQVGQILLIVKANATPQRAVLAARERLDGSKAINLLLNQAGLGDSARLYGEYHGYGYGYGGGE